MRKTTITARHIFLLRSERSAFVIYIHFLVGKDSLLRPLKIYEAFRFSSDILNRFLQNYKIEFPRRSGDYLNLISEH